jgi:hypothetical protein
MTNEIEEWVKNNTFHCDRLKANITQEQCRKNQIRAHIEVTKPFRPSHLNAPEDAENFFWKDENDNPVESCVDCSRFSLASRKEIEAQSSTTTMTRYPPTEDGIVAKKLLHYQYNHQEKLYEEEQDYLSRSSPKQRKVAKLYIET